MVAWPLQHKGSRRKFAVKESTVSEQGSAEWLENVRLGALQAMTYFRGRLQADAMSPEDREGLIDLLNYTEDHLRLMWEYVEEHQAVAKPELMALTAQAGRKTVPQTRTSIMLRSLERLMDEPHDA